MSILGSGVQYSFIWYICAKCLFINSNRFVFSKQRSHEILLFLEEHDLLCTVLLLKTNELN